MNTYLKTDIDTKFPTSNLLTHAKANSSSIELGDSYRVTKSVDNNTFSVEPYSLNSASNYNVWLSLVSVEYNDDTMLCNLDVDKTDMLIKINELSTIHS